MKFLKQSEPKPYDISNDYYDALFEGSEADNHARGNDNYLFFVTFIRRA
jgi:hypothetical protein